MFILIALVIATILGLAESRRFHFSKTLKVNSWNYLDKYVFNGSSNNGRITISFESVNPRAKIYFYNNAADLFNGALAHKNECREFTAYKYVTTSVGPTSNYVIDIPITPSPTTWFAVVALCDKTAGANSTFFAAGDIHWEDYDRDYIGKSWDRELDYAERNIFEVLTFFCTLAVLLFGFQLYTYVCHWRPPRHPATLIVLLITLANFIGLLLKQAWAAGYAKNGQSTLYPVQAVGEVFIFLYQVAVFLFGIAVCSGWLISAPTVNKKALGAYGSIYGAVAIAMYAYAVYLYLEDPLFDFMYNSIPGYIFSTMRIIFGIIICCVGLKQRRHEGDSKKKTLYTLFITLFSIWSLGGAVIGLLSIAMPYWFEECFTWIAGYSLDFTITMFLVYMVHPNVLEKNFDGVEAVLQKSAESDFIKM